MNRSPDASNGAVLARHEPKTIKVAPKECDEPVQVGVKSVPFGTSPPRPAVFVGLDRPEVYAPAALDALGIKTPKSLIMLTGGAAKLDKAMKDDPALQSRLIQLFSRGVARAAIDAEALIIAGGTQSGVMKLMGQGVADRGHKTPLIGVTPAGKAVYTGGPVKPDDGYPLEPNHTHFVLVDSDQWGRESHTMFALADVLVERFFREQSQKTASAKTTAEGGKAKATTKRGRIAAWFSQLLKPKPSKSEDALPQKKQMPEAKQEKSEETPDDPVAQGEKQRGEQGDPAWQQTKLDGESAATADVHASVRLPVVTVVACGNVDGITKDEVLRSVRRGWPVAIIKGSGGLADRVAEEWEKRHPPEGEAPKAPADGIKDPALAEIVEEGNLHIFSDESPILDFQPMLARLIPVWTDDKTLEQAWMRFAIYDQAAKRHRRGFGQVQWWILFLGVVGTALVVLKTSLGWLGTLSTASTSEIAALGPAASATIRELAGRWSALHRHRSLIDEILYYLILAVPIMTTILTTAANKFTSGGKWVLLRSSAEAIKREIYTYRAGTGKYSKDETARKGTTPRAELASQVETISSRLMRTEVNMTALRKYEDALPPDMEHAAPGEDGFSPLSPDRYVQIRLGDQINFFEKKTAKLERSFKRRMRVVWAVGGMGTFLAAVGAQVWVALTTAIVSAYLTYLEYEQTTDTLLRYNQTRTDLKNVRDWWDKFSPIEKKDPENIRKLVTVTERLLQSEQAGWVQDMQDALAELREEQSVASKEDAQSKGAA